MATLTLKNVPEGLVTRLKEVASRNRRSLNQETLSRLETSLGGVRRSGDEMVAALRRVHEELVGARPLTDAILRRAKTQGRP
jgi:plasmid stability protein